MTVLEINGWDRDDLRAMTEAWEALCERIADMLRAITELWQRLSEIVLELAETIMPIINASTVLWRRALLYEQFSHYVRLERLAWWLARHWPERWLPPLAERE